MKVWTVFTASWWSSSTSLDGCVWGCQSRNIIPRGRQQTNWVTKTISSSRSPSFNSQCAQTLIREFTSNAFSAGQVHHLYLIYLTWCKYCWSFTGDLVRPHFSEVHSGIKLVNAAAICRRSGGMQIKDTFVRFGYMCDAFHVPPLCSVNVFDFVYCIYDCVHFYINRAPFPSAKRTREKIKSHTIYAILMHREIPPEKREEFKRILKSNT